MTISIFKRAATGSPGNIHTTNGRYLVVAHETATSAQLLERLVSLADRDRGATFTLVVPATTVENGLTWTEGESIGRAQKAALLARTVFEDFGLRVDRAFAGDVSPVQAIADELAWGNRYDALIISTFPPGLSKWLRLDVHRRARQRFNVRVISVIAERRAALVAA